MQVLILSRCVSYHLELAVTVQLFTTTSQTSFALGRPDGLGSDVFHTCHIPGSQDVSNDNGPVEDSSLQILPIMVSFSRIMRRVATELYAVQDPLSVRFGKIDVLDRDL